MQVGFLVRTGPYTSQNIDTVYELARRLLNQGHSVALFLYEDGVFNIKKNIQSPQERNIKDRMAELTARGAVLRACGTCSKFRGQGKEDIIENSKLAGLAVLVDFINQSDRFISFGF
jgi:tRNA 2-thiouridine synthesizing protein D